MSKRHKPKGFSLTFRLSLAFTLLIIMLMGAVGFSIFVRDRDMLTKNTIERGWTLMDSINVVARDAISSERYDALNELMTKFKVDGFVMEAAVFDIDGKMVACGEPSEENTYLKSVYKKVDKQKMTLLKNDSGDTVGFAFASPIYDDMGKTYGFTHVLVDLSSILIHLQKTGYNLIVIFVIAVLIGLIIARFVVVKSVGKPVGELMEVTENVSIGDFSYRLDVTRSDELGRLAQAFNTMSDQLGVLFNTIKNVVGEMNTISSLIVHGQKILNKQIISAKEFIKEINHGARDLIKWVFN